MTAIKKLFDIGDVPNQGTEWNGKTVKVTILGADKKPLGIANHQKRVAMLKKFAGRPMMPRKRHGKGKGDK